MEPRVPLQKALEGTWLSPSAAQPFQGTQRPGKRGSNQSRAGWSYPRAGSKEEEPHGSKNETILTFAPNPQHALVSKPPCRGIMLKGPVSARPHHCGQASSPSWASTVLWDRDGHPSPPSTPKQMVSPPTPAINIHGLSLQHPSAWKFNIAGFQHGGKPTGPSWPWSR